MRTLSLILVVAVLLSAPNSRGQDPKKGDGVKELAELDRQIAAKEKELAELKAKADAVRYTITAPIDLTKVDRTIAKEPAYKTKPRYCLLVFGPEPKIRVWLVLDGDVLYVDRNGNGDLTHAVRFPRPLGHGSPGLSCGCDCRPCVVCSLDFRSCEVEGKHNGSPGKRPFTAAK